MLFDITHIARTQRLAITDGQTTTSNYNTSSNDTESIQPCISKLY